MTDLNGSGSDRPTETPDQGDLFAPWPTWSPDSPAGKFEQFHAANPRVWEVITAEARRWKRDGRGKLGISLLIGRVRWVLSVETNSTGDGFRINDHYAPYYARLVMAECSDLADIFEVRRSLDADEWIADYRQVAA